MESFKKRLGEMLVERGLVTEDQIEKALEHQRHTGERLGSSLVEMGFLSEPSLAVFLSKQSELPCINIADVKVPEDILALIPADPAREHRMLPVRVSDATLYVAVADPPDERTAAETERLSGMETCFMIAPRFRIERAIEGNYGHRQVPFVTFAS